MRTTRTIMIFSDIERERALLNSLINTFGKRPHTLWQSIDEGVADVVVMSLSNPSLEQIRQAQKLAKVVVFFVSEEDSRQLSGQPFLLNKQSRARDFLALIERLEGWFGDEETEAAEAVVRPVKELSAPHYSANDYRAVLAG